MKYSDNPEIKSLNNKNIQQCSSGTDGIDRTNIISNFQTNYFSEWVMKKSGVFRKQNDLGTENF